MKYFIISKIECPCCCTVKKLLTSEKYLNLNDDEVIVIYDNPSKDLLNFIKDANGVLNTQLEQFIDVKNNTTIADTYPCVFHKNGNKFEYLEGGKDGMLKRFVDTLQNEYPNLYSKLLDAIKEKLADPDFNADIFCKYVECELKPNEEQLNLHIAKLEDELKSQHNNNFVQNLY